ncbi:class I adenylate-forming enzyme family protein [Nocardioides sp.]|uniref:class I adenylate-forming enzyme family protein n=1 Tax=Nocardioides sp. TaxID=35761 RepID=UPI002ED15314
MSGQPDVSALVARAAAERPDAVALVAGARRLTWAELEELVARVATGIGGAGVVAGQRVLVALGNRVEFVTAYLGTLRAQAVSVPVNPTSTPHELARMIADSGARLAIGDSTTLAALREAVAVVDRARDGEPGALDPDLVQRAVATRVVALDEPPADGELGFDELLAVEPRDVPPLQDPEKLAALLYTSGTSGRPRAAMLTHRALLANVEQVAAVEPPMMRADDIVLGVLPLFHVYGLNAVLGGVARHGCTLVLTERFEPEATLDLITAESCTVVPVAPPVFAHWRSVSNLRERLASVRLVLSGSAPLAASAIEEFGAATGIELHQGYGLTEAAPVVTSTLCSRTPHHGSVGAALPGIELRLVDDRGHPPEGEDPGEIQVCGANLFSGYWPDGDEAPGVDGWWSTGDVGFLDPSGDLFLVDRVKELVIVSGFNVYPIEVEDVIREVDGVEEVAVIGAEDEQTGEAVVAYVRAPGAEPAAVEAAVRARCEERLAGFKRPSRVEVVDELPLTVTGKVQKGRLRGLERRRALGILE